MPTYLVISPEYGEVVPILDYGVGPMEYASDVIRVDAPNKRAARVLAVRTWRKEKWVLKYCEFDENPYRGLKVELETEEEQEENA